MKNISLIILTLFIATLTNAQDLNNLIIDSLTLQRQRADQPVYIPKAFNCSGVSARWVPIANGTTSETDAVMCAKGSIGVGLDPAGTGETLGRIHSITTNTVQNNHYMQREGISDKFCQKISTNASSKNILMIAPTTALQAGMHLQADGNLGLGTYVADRKLDVAGTIRSKVSGTNAVTGYFSSSDSRHMYMVPQLGTSGYSWLSSANDFGIFWTDGGASGGANNTAGFLIAPQKGAAYGLKILANGNVGIGLVTPAYKLDVCGNIRAKEVLVNLTGCDFVFENDYKLMPLNELEAYIKQNKHLPEIAPAKEMETEEGFALGELQSKLLQKVEELTLYVIELKKENEVLKKDISELKK